jgi:hypothetical protein
MQGQINHAGSVILRSMTFRAYAALCEERAHSDTCAAGRSGWQEAALDWHALADAAALEEELTVPLAMKMTSGV